MTGTKYRLGDRLGGGGMAEVFRATLVGAEGFARPVAIKRVLPGYSADEMFADMLKAEARIASLLTHPNIVSVLDFDRDEEERLFLVMELVEGKNLAEVLMMGRLPLSMAVFAIAELLRALAFAHALEHRGQPMFIVHRDVSPQNILIAWSGAVKLGDFGIAKAAATTQVTKTGVVKGKVAYLSPEQALAKDLDGRSDLFAVGIVLHELLCGRRLFSVKSGAQEAVIVHRVLTLPIDPPRAINTEISAELDAVCMKLLERDRDARYQTAEQALEALLVCPEMSKRGELEMAELLSARFPKEAPAPGSWQAFAARTKTAPPASASSKSAPLEYGGFSAVGDDPPAPPPRKGGTSPLEGRKEVPSGETQLLVPAPAPPPSLARKVSDTAIVSGASITRAPRAATSWKTLTAYGVLGLCAAIIVLLGSRVWQLYFGPAVPKTTPIVEDVVQQPPAVLVRTSTPTTEQAPAITKKSTKKVRLTKTKQTAPTAPETTEPAQSRPDAGLKLDRVVAPDLPTDGDRVIKPDL